MTLRADTLGRLEDREHKYRSQYGEDGVIAAIFAALGTTDCYCVEFGVEDAVECNTAHLLDLGWTGLLLDGAGVSRNPAAAVHREFITADNIRELFAKYRVPQQFDLLSIDIDGNDYWVWRAITHQPRVVVIEYNASRLVGECSTIAYDPQFRWDGSDYFGASLRALVELGQTKGYVLVHCSKEGTNAFFVLQSALPAGFVPKPWYLLYRPPTYSPTGGGHRADPERRMADPSAML